MISRGLFLESKKLRIFDFDDTLVKTKSFVYVTKPNGRKLKLTPGEYAVYTPREGDEFDYSDFQSVNEPTEIKKMTNVLRRMVRSNGSSGMYILTARASYQPIKQYLSDIGINSNSVYVIALASNDPKDKADWIEMMIDEKGYNDVYFADDSLKNVEATKRMLRGKDIKWRVQHIKEHKSYKI
jgi:FMN phosphatase YigB (HAD superfamily)